MEVESEAELLEGARTTGAAAALTAAETSAVGEPTEARSEAELLEAAGAAAGAVSVLVLGNIGVSALGSSS